MLVLSFLFACATAESPSHEAAEAEKHEEHAAEGEKAAEAEGEKHEEPGLAGVPSGDGWTLYGVAPTLAAAEPAAGLLTDPTGKVNQTVRVEGKVSSVCQKAGCWLVLADDKGNQLRVTMKEHGFAVPKDCNGQVADIEGQLVEKVVDQKTVEHYKSESNGGPVPEEGKEKHFEIVANGVRLKTS